MRNVCCLQEPNRDALVLYARFTRGAVHYVLNQVIETTFARDRDFVAWRAQHLADLYKACHLLRTARGSLSRTDTPGAP